MDGGRGPGDAVAAISPVLRWATGAVAVLVLLALAVIVPGLVSSGADHRRSAHQLVDEVAAGRAELLAKQDEIRSPIKSLGVPVRAWSAVSCWITPRHSDGDGERDVVVFYWQRCALVAYEIYPLPTDAGDIAEVAADLGGSTRGDASCADTIYDVLTPELGASSADEYAAELRWVDPDGAAPADEPEHCALPAPDDADTAHIEMSTDEPLVADAYLLYQVTSPVRSVDVSCDHGSAWSGSCTGEPEGFPSMSGR